MKKISRFISVIAIMSAVIFAAISASSIARSDGSDQARKKTKQEEVLEHRQSKNILAYKDILKAVQPHIDGEIIEAEFEIEDGVAVYEIKYIDKSGRVLEIYVDAKTGVILKKESH